MLGAAGYTYSSYVVSLLHNPQDVDLIPDCVINSPRILPCQVSRDFRSVRSGKGRMDSLRARRLLGSGSGSSPGRAGFVHVQVL